MSATAFQRLRREMDAKNLADVKVRPDVSTMTKKDIKTLLDAKSIEYDAKATKPELIKLLEGAE